MNSEYRLHPRELRPITESVPACERCRQMRRKCEAQLPSCRKCEDAKVECTFYDSTLQETLPRRYIQSLQLQLKELQERRDVLLNSKGDIKAPQTGSLFSSHVRGPGVSNSYSQTAAPSSNAHGELAPRQQSSSTQTLYSRSKSREAIRKTIRASTELRAMINVTIPSGPYSTDIVRRVRMGLTPSHILYPSREGEIQKNEPSKTCDGAEYVKASILASLPSHVVHTLVKRYIQYMLPYYPFLHKISLWKQLDRVLGLRAQHSDSPELQESAKAAPDYDFLVIYLVLSISATLGAKNGHEARCMAFSQSLFAEGLQHFSNIARYPSEISWIQITLLLLQYASINPKSGNVWILSGFAMRNCLELGLHREVSQCENELLDPQTVDLGRRVFWTAYCMDRSICGALQRPLSIPDLAIDAGVMSAIDDNSIPPLGVDYRGNSIKDIGVCWIRYRQIQSAIIEVHFQGRELESGQSWQEWLGAIEKRLREWYENVDHDEWTSFAFTHGLASLHRPSPRNPFPSPESLLVSFESACESARLCRQQILSGYLPRLWLAAHNTFEMALVVIFCLRHNWVGITAHYDNEQIFEMTKLFTQNLLTISGQGWPEIVEYGGIYERHLAYVLEPLFRPGISTQCVQPDPERDAELTRLLYPRPATSMESKLQDGMAWNAEYLPFDQTLFNWDDHDLVYSGLDL